MAYAEAAKAAYLNRGVRVWRPPPGRMVIVCVMGFFVGIAVNTEGSWMFFCSDLAWIS